MEVVRTHRVVGVHLLAGERQVASMVLHVSGRRRVRVLVLVLEVVTTRNI